MPIFSVHVLNDGSYFAPSVDLRISSEVRIKRNLAIISGPLVTAREIDDMAREVMSDLRAWVQEAKALLKVAQIEARQNVASNSGADG